MDGGGLSDQQDEKGSEGEAGCRGEARALGGGGEVGVGGCLGRETAVAPRRCAGGPRLGQHTHL